MALYQATVKLSQSLSHGQVLEKGMRVTFSSFAPPWSVQGGMPINEAYLRVFGIDLKANQVLGPGFIEVIQIG